MSALFETLILLRLPLWPEAKFRLPATFSLSTPHLSKLVCLPLVLLASLSQVPGSSLLAGDHLPQGLTLDHFLFYLSLLCLSFLTDEMSVSNSDNLSTLLP